MEGPRGETGGGREGGTATLGRALVTASQSVPRLRVLARRRWVAGLSPQEVLGRLVSIAGEHPGAECARGEVGAQGTAVLIA
jgi:hypothetical protein